MAQNKFPPQTKFIIGNEACERFGFYGIRAMLATYITTVLLMSENAATEIIHLFVAVNYLMPLIGAWISDKYWGRYKTILYISLIYCLGMGTLACSDLFTDISMKRNMLLIGLFIVGMGSGGIKPCVASFMGDQFKPEDSHLLKKAYAAFYWTINFGSFFAFLLIPIIQAKQGWSWAFAVPGVFMGIATLIFWLGRHKYTNIPPSGKTKDSVFAVYKHCFKNRKSGQKFFEPAKTAFSQEHYNDAKSLLSILKIFLWVPIFWALYDQTASTWIMQGERMTPIHLPFGDTTIKAPQIQAANPVFVMLLIPLITIFVYPRLRKWGEPLKRMGLGFFFTALSFLIVGFYQMQIDNGVSLSLAWQILPYLILTIGEVLMSTTGLEFAYTQAPARLKSTLNSYWTLTIFAGNIIIVGVTQLMGVFGASSNSSASTGAFLGYGIVTFIVGFIFLFISRHYKYKKSHHEQENIETDKLKELDANS